MAVTNSPVRLARVVAGALIAAPCAGQETVTFDIRFADPVLTPGQVQHVEVWAIMEPGIGQPAVWVAPSGTHYPGFAVCFASAQFDLLNIANGQTGAFSNLATNPLLNGGGAFSAGTPNALGSVLGVQASQFSTMGSFANPILPWSAEWTPLDYAPRGVEFESLATYGPEVWLEVGFGLPVADTWSGMHPHASFTVVPAPGALIWLACMGLSASIRRRVVPHNRLNRPTARGKQYSGRCPEDDVRWPEP